ncbi:signal transduction histidine kinase [Terriglobus roseus DSM 18391]|uniref:histidine kinase n=1 Tax=Terriglobus roseus (strain DSM 18391 / NRRL B-41598 / KBS 63) TaxID=926566 RepID=I3ZE32_TERRK|nr:ATP-binding protein [Terriglobus roseus]AFL87500.1 signal transduction histidine kinase [Terriglobus roseus DSM 18391]
MTDPSPGNGIRTRVLLQVSVALIILVTMACSLVVIGRSLRQRAAAQLHDDLQNSLQTFQDLQLRRRASLERENRLLAALPTLRALMTTHDARTVQEGAKDFRSLSGNDLFALVNPDGTIVAAEAQGIQNQEQLRRELGSIMTHPGKRYLVASGKLFEYSVEPVYFGSPESGTLLAYVIDGYLVDRRLMQEVGRGAGAEALFLADDHVAASTLPEDRLLTQDWSAAFPSRSSDGVVLIGGRRYLGATRDLPDGAGMPLRLIVLKSFDEAEEVEREIRRIVLLVSLLAVLGGSALMILLARTVTSPLERLAAAVRAFAGGDRRYQLPEGGPQELRYLSHVLAEMRYDIEKKNHALLESERLATIGRMASSVSHDLRHYLAAIYANSEFLASSSLTTEERAELFEEIRLAVDGTTDMLDSLLLFGSTGTAVRRADTSMQSVVHRAVALVRAHPDGETVNVHVEEYEGDATGEIDARQMERAIYNLLLNACQAAAEGDASPQVTVALSGELSSISVTVSDSGPGVPDAIRHSLFDPFVSKGKQKGTGLGLTLASSVAHEHGGSVELISSRAGETVFRITIERHNAGMASKLPDSSTMVSQ